MLWLKGTALLFIPKVFEFYYTETLKWKISTQDLTLISVVE